GPQVEGQAKPKVTKEELQAKVKKETLVSDAEVKALRQAELLNTTKAKSIPELIQEIKSTGKEFSVDDLHTVAKGGRISDKQSRKMAEEIFNNKEALKEKYARNFREPLKKEELEALAMEGAVRQLEVDNFVAGVKNVDDLTDA